MRGLHTGGARVQCDEHWAPLHARTSRNVDTNLSRVGPPMRDDSSSVASPQNASRLCGINRAAQGRGQPWAQTAWAVQARARRVAQAIPCCCTAARAPRPEAAPWVLVSPVGECGGAEGSGVQYGAAQQCTAAFFQSTEGLIRPTVRCTSRVVPASCAGRPALAAWREGRVWLGRHAAHHQLFWGRSEQLPGRRAHLYFLLALVSLEARSLSRSRLPSSSLSLLQTAGDENA